jgi:uncharacterized membrane protein/uncharacterized protein YegL
MWRRTFRLRGWKKGASVGLRALILLLLAMALAGAGWYENIRRQAVVWVVDRSDSVAEMPSLMEWMRKAARAKSPQDATGVVSAGLNAAVEKIVDERNLDAFAFAARVNRQFTDVASALRLAESLLPEDTNPRIVVVSDGKENVGDMLAQGKLLKNKGIAVDVLPVSSKKVKDAAIEEVRIPEKLYRGETFTIELGVASTQAAAAVLRVYEDNRELVHEEVQLEAGKNRFVLQGFASEPGLRRYRAEVYVEGDGQSSNDVGYALSRVAGQPKVLVVEGQPGAAHNLTDMLEAGFIPYERITPELLPRELPDYTAYESIILDNVPATRMSIAQMEMIERAVRDYGVGLVMTGGEDSFGLGGYFQTPIEKALPVYMDLRGNREIPSLGLILVIDKSGSMMGDKIRLAQEAAARTAELLRDQDTIGVLAFDSSPWWVVAPQKLEDRRKVIDNIMSIPADGGTDVYAAVEEAYRRMLDIDAQRRHIILLTDGQSSSPKNYDALAAEMVRNNITLSSVAIGRDADQALLRRLAERAGGRYYYTDDQSTVPAIFSRETVLMSRTYIVDEPFVPAIGQGADWRELFAGGMPQVQAYVATTPKETAEVALLSPQTDPLLARWQYGAGRAVAWTSDTAGKWAAEWVSWSEFPQVFGRIIKWTFPQFAASPFALESRLRGNELTLEARSNIPDFRGDLKATITDESLEAREIRFTPTAPGEYAAQFAIDQPGVYMARIDVLEPGDSAPPEAERKLLGSVTEGFVVPYSPEYRLSDGDQSEKLKRLAEMTGGRVLSADRPEEVFRNAVAAKKKLHDLSDFLLRLSLILWVVDIAVRRLSIPWRTMVPKRTPRNRPLHAEESARHERLSRLKERMREAQRLHRAAEEEAARPSGVSGDGGREGVPRGSSEPASPIPNKSAADGAPPAEGGAASGKPPENPAPGASPEGGDTFGRLLAARRRAGKK